MLHTQLKVQASLKHDYFEKKPKFSKGLSSLDKHRKKTLKGFVTIEWQKDYFSMSEIEQKADIQHVPPYLSKVECIKQWQALKHGFESS